MTEAVRAAITDGVSFSRPTVHELAAAEDFLRLVPGADMVKFAKNGSDVTTAAVRLARAVTGRVKVAICDQPFFSTDDWFIGTTPMAAGIPTAIRDLTVGFPYNDLDALDALFDAHPDRIAAVVMEGDGPGGPAAGYLEAVGELCRRRGAVWIVDEIIAGFRLAHGGAQERFGVTADLCTFGKALGNGLAIAALVGRPEIMELGGLHTDRDRVFLLSTTYGAETPSLAAALAVMDAYEREGVIARMRAAGERLAAGVTEVVAAAGLSDHVQVHGRPENLVFATLDADGERSQWFRALFMQELIARGVLGPSFVVSAAHTDDDIDATVDAVAGALGAYARGLVDGPESVLDGGPTKLVFRTRA